MRNISNQKFFKI